MSFHQVHGKNRGVGRQASVKCIFDNRLCAASSPRGAFCLLAEKNLGKMNCICVIRTPYCKALALELLAPAWRHGTVVQPAQDVMCEQLFPKPHRRGGGGVCWVRTHPGPPATEELQPCRMAWTLCCPQKGYHILGQNGDLAFL